MRLEKVTRSAMASKKPTVLVVAPDQAMLRSLTFALEAEGYMVEAEPGFLRAPPARGHPETACAIVDEAALPDPKNLSELSRLRLPVVLLVERKGRMPALPGLSLVEKPPLGRDLLDAVAAASRQGRPTQFPVGR